MTPVRRRAVAAAALYVPLLLPLLFVSTGCATRPPATSPDDPWTSGRLSVRVEPTAERPARSVSAAFDLRGNGDRGELRLVSPLGTVLAAARWSPGQAALTTPEGSTTFGDLDALSRQAFGEVLPLAALPDWLAGRPWPGAASRVVGGGFEQLGWLVVVARRVDGIVEARRAEAPAVTVRALLDAAQ